MSADLRPPTLRTKALPVIYQKLGEIPLTFFKLYLPSYRCPRCGEKGLFVKVSANDGKALTEYWELEGPRENFENMKGLELHQGVAAQGGFKCEPIRASRVVDHLDIFGEARVRSSHLVRALVQANLFIKNHAPVGPASWPQDPPTIRYSADVRVSGQREMQAPAQSAGDRIVEDGPGGNVSPHLANRTQRATEGERRSGDGSESGRVLSPSSSLVLKPPRPAATPRAQGVRDDG